MSQSKTCIRDMKEAEEKKLLGPFAVLSAESRGRRRPESLDPSRTGFERDVGRILYSMDFRRLRHKTQVFFNPRSDHVCTRMEHVLYVSYISRIIGSALGLNQNLIEAIALGHDLGHVPFGHSGEKALNDILRKDNVGFSFKHEAQSLRVIDVLAEYRGKRQGLNLSFEVRDGIASHCGEKYQETYLKPWRDKSEEDIHQGISQHALPATLEGCVVRLADRIAYLGRDIEDAARAGLMDFEDLPAELQQSLGSSNREMVNVLVSDIISESRGQDVIKLSQEKSESMSELLQIGVRRIYSAEKVHKFEFITRQVIEGLYYSFLAIRDPEKAAADRQEVLRRFGEYMLKHPEPEASQERKVCDYIAGMTDHYAMDSFKQLYTI